MSKLSVSSVQNRDLISQSPRNHAKQNPRDVCLYLISQKKNVCSTLTSKLAPVIDDQLKVVLLSYPLPRAFQENSKTCMFIEQLKCGAYFPF